jgi:serine/threonine protein kinase
MNHIFSGCCLGGNVERETEQQTNSKVNAKVNPDVNAKVNPGSQTNTTTVIKSPMVSALAPALAPAPARICFEKGGFSKHDIRFRGLLAKGAYAAVHKISGVNESDNISCKYVCKICDCNPPDGFMGAFLREICILKHLSSPRFNTYNKNIIPLYDIIYDVRGSNTIGLIMPRRRFSLHQYMIKYVNMIDTRNICFIITEILSGLHFIHENGIIHRDIKPANILIEGNFVQICDFNLAKSIDGIHKEGSHTNEVVTTPYRAPEVWRKQKYSYPIDIWSVGVILLEIIMGKFIFKMFNTEVNNTVAIKRLLIDYKFNRFYGIMSQMLDFNQLTRVSAANALKDPIFLNYKKRNVESVKIPPVQKVVEIIPKELSEALKKYGVLKEITKCLAGNIFRVSRCSAENAALMAIKMCEDDLATHFKLESYKNAEFDILKKMRFNLVISGKSEYFADA